MDKIERYNNARKIAVAVHKKLHGDQLADIRVCSEYETELCYETKCYHCEKQIFFDAKMQHLVESQSTDVCGHCAIKYHKNDMEEVQFKILEYALNSRGRI